MHDAIPALARRVAVVLATLVSATSLLLASAGPVVAECNPPGADPSFRKAAPYARTILVGRVVAVAPDTLNPGGPESYRFTVSVERTLRGTAPSTLVLDRIETGSCVRWLAAAVGDRVALALEASSTDRSVPRNMAAWLDGRTHDTSSYEVLTLAEVLELAGRRVPETSTLNGPLPPVESGGHLFAWLGVVLTSFIVSVIALARDSPLTHRPGTRRRDGPDSRPAVGCPSTRRRERLAGDQ